LGAELLKIDLNGINDITETDFGYRFYPHRTRGEVFSFLFSEKIASTVYSKQYKQDIKKGTKIC